MPKEISLNFERSESDNDINNDNLIMCNIENEFPLKSGWAIKKNQKFGKKGGGKRIPKVIVELLKSYFHLGNYDKSQRFTPEDMHNELIEESVHNAQFSLDEIPKVETIRNWVSRYSAEMKKDVADKMLTNYNK